MECHNSFLVLDEKRSAFHTFHIFLRGAMITPFGANLKKCRIDAFYGAAPRLIQYYIGGGLPSFAIAYRVCVGGMSLCTLDTEWHVFQFLHTIRFVSNTL